MTCIYRNNDKKGYLKNTKKKVDKKFALCVNVTYICIIKNVKTMATVANQNIKAEIINKGSWLAVQIFETETAVCQTLKNGVWVNMDPKEFKTVVLIFDKCFCTEEDAGKFMTSKLFKGVFKAVQKNY